MIRLRPSPSGHAGARTGVPRCMQRGHVWVWGGACFTIKREGAPGTVWQSGPRPSGQPLPVWHPWQGGGKHATTRLAAGGLKFFAAAPVRFQITLKHTHTKKKHTTFAITAAPIALGPQHVRPGERQPTTSTYRHWVLPWTHRCASCVARVSLQRSRARQLHGACARRASTNRNGSTGIPTQRGRS